MISKKKKKKLTNAVVTITMIWKECHVNFLPAIIYSWLTELNVRCTALCWYFHQLRFKFPKWVIRFQDCFHHRSHKRFCLYSLETIFVTKQYLPKVQPLPGNIILLNHISGKDENQWCFELQLSWYFSLSCAACDVQLVQLWHSNNQILHYFYKPGFVKSLTYNTIYFKWFVK